jgi:hypothetical protein
MAKSPKNEPKPGGAERSARPAAGARVPRYDDRPEAARGKSGDAELNPSIPRYGDTEPGDPRRSNIEAGVEPDDDDELAGDELDMVDEEEEET